MGVKVFWVNFSRRPFVFFMLHENEARGFPLFRFVLVSSVLAFFHRREIYQLLLYYLTFNCPDMVIYWNDRALFFSLWFWTFAVYCFEERTREVTISQSSFVNAVSESKNISSVWKGQGRGKVYSVLCAVTARM